MTATLHEPLHRLIDIPGVGEVVLTISSTGVAFRLQRTQNEVTASWLRVIEVCDITSPNVPTRVIGKPFAYLQFMAAKILKRQTRNASASTHPLFKMKNDFYRTYRFLRIKLK